jgi:ketosteroid isomerase-like protein
LRAGDKIVVARLLAKDVIIFEGGGVERSVEEYAKRHMLLDMQHLAAVEITQLEHQVFTNGDIAYSISRSKTHGTYNDKNIDYITLETMTLKNTDSGWKLRISTSQSKPLIRS